MGDQPLFLVALMVKMKEFRGQGETTPRPLVYACLRLWQQGAMALGYGFASWLSFSGDT